MPTTSGGQQFYSISLNRRRMEIELDRKRERVRAAEVLLARERLAFRRSCERWGQVDLEP